MNIKSNPLPINPNKIAKGITALTREGATLPVVLLETTVTAGRTYQAEKRSGYVEARERFFDEAITAVFWLFGNDIFNKLGDKVCKKLFKLPTVDFDAGKDALRSPMKNLSSNLALKAKHLGEKPISNSLLSKIKFGKIISSIVLSTSLVGFALPKINMSITKKIKEQMKNEGQIPTVNPNVQQNSMQKTDAQNSSESIDVFKNRLTGQNMQKPASQNSSESIDGFKNRLTVQNIQKQRPAFAGAMFSPEGLAQVAHNLEHHTVYKLLATDGGIFVGRAANAWNKDDRIEKLFRDLTSSFFYLFSTGLVMSGLQKLDKYGNISKLNPTTADLLHNKMLINIKSVGGSMNIADFKDAMLGSISDKNKTIMQKIPFKDDVTTLKSVVKELKNAGHSKELLLKAAEMSKLQPVKSGEGRVLTKRQVQDILTNSKNAQSGVDNPKFLMNAYKGYFGDALTNPYKYISMKEINKFRNNIDDYVNTVIKAAESSSEKIITEKLLNKMKKQNIVKSGAFYGVGFAISALFLSTLIPKAQYLITKIRTGKDQFPGLDTPVENVAESHNTAIESKKV